MAPKYILQFDVDAACADLQIEIQETEFATKQANPHRFEISKRWRQMTRKLIIRVALSAGSTMQWYWDLAHAQFQSRQLHDV